MGFSSSRHRFTLGIFLTALFIMGTFAYSMVGFFLPRIEDYLLDQRYEMVKRMMELAMSDLNSRNEDVLYGRSTREEAQRRFLDRYRKIRYGEDGRDYYWILDKTPVLIMHPYRPDLEGDIIGEIPDLDLSHILTEMVRIADSTPEGGFLEYDWQFKDDATLIKPKISYVRAFAPWGWIIGTGAYLDDINGELSSFRKSIMLIILIVLLLTALGIAILSTLAISSRNRREISEQRFKTLFDLLPFSCVINSLDGKVLEANRYHCAMTGLTREEIRGSTSEDVQRHMEPADREELFRELETAGSVSAREVRLKTEEGVRWILLYNCLIDWHNGKSRLSVSMDITDRKKASMELQRTASRMSAQRDALARLAESEEIGSGIASRAIPELTRQAAAALEVDRVGTWIYRKETNEIVNLDQYVASRDEHSSGETLCLDNYPSYWRSIRYETRIDAHDAMTDPRLEELRQDWIIPRGITSLMDAGIMQEGHFAGLFSCEHTGPEREWHADEQAFVSSLAALAGQIFATDERRCAEISLRASEESLRATLRSMGDGVIVADRERRITLMNQVAEGMTGWTLEEVRDRDISDVYRVIRKDGGEPASDIPSRVIADGRIIKHPDHTALVSRGGEEYLISDSGAPIFSEEGRVTGVVIVFRNITKEKELQDQFNQIQKMESIGQLAGGVAHDFNNMLGGIMGAAELLKDTLADSSDSLEYVALILESSQRAASLTGKLLTFARKQRLSHSPINSLDPLRDAVSFLRSTVDRRIRVHEDLPDGDIPMRGDKSELQNAYLNILINATHAMPEGGNIYVNAGLRDLDENFCDAIAMDIEPGAYLEVTIRDEGSGIPPGDLKRIFEPFFTTKEQGKGTGLGLSSVFGTIQQYGGAIDVESEVGKGSTFHIYLPLGQEESGKEPDSNESIPTGTGTVLLADDEAVVRKTVGSLLKSLGYEVLMAENGRQALEIFRERSAEIDLVILDMVMPDMNGKDSFFAMKEIDPRVKVLLSTGFTREEDLEGMKLSGLSGIINKPYNRAELAKAIGSVLDR